MNHFTLLKYSLLYFHILGRGKNFEAGASGLSNYLPTYAVLMGTECMITVTTFKIYKVQEKVPEFLS